ncbi:MAG TPA: hypothetical protein VGC38_07825 [Pseudolabrys sp.]
MLVANREPFHSGAHDAPPPRGLAARLGRAMSAMQIIGTLLAIPVGIGSAVTMYRANFSSESTCQTLRNNIVAMLDKSVDATTRHMLVRRDVEAFESSCRNVDPDATAAFKALLAADKKAAAVTPAPPPTPVATAPVRRIETKPEVAVRKTDPLALPGPKETAVKEPVAKPSAAAAETAAVQRDASDVVWVDAVRRALGAPAPDAAPVAVKETVVTPQAPAAEMAKPVAVVPKPVATQPVVRETHPAVEAKAPAAETRPQAAEPKAPAVALAPTPETQAMAPALPPAEPLSIVPQPPAEEGHPVPPEAIPDAPPVEKADAVHPKSGLGALASRIPLVGWAFGK